MAKLTAHRYGKARVRVLKILRDGPVHALKDLDVALSERCCTLAAMPEVIKAATHFAWWPAATPPSSPAH